jgi:hypothetical protein
MLRITRSLYEDLFVYEDVVAAARMSELSTSLTAITCSFRVLGIDSENQAASLAKFIADAGIHKSVRLDEGVFQSVVSSSSFTDGWLFIWVKDMGERHKEWEQEMNAERVFSAEILQTLIVSTISTVTMAIHWCPLKAIIDTEVTKGLLLLTISRSVSFFDLIIACNSPRGR